MWFKKIFIFSFLFVIGIFIYGQDSSKKEAEIRSYCQLMEQAVPNAGAIAWGMIRQLNPTFDEKLVTVGQDGIKRIGLCQIPEDVLNFYTNVFTPEYPYTIIGSITIASGIYNTLIMLFPKDQKATMFASILFMLYGKDGMKPLSLDDLKDDINFNKIYEYAINFQKGIF